MRVNQHIDKIKIKSYKLAFLTNVIISSQLLLIWIEFFISTFLLNLGVLIRKLHFQGFFQKMLNFEELIPNFNRVCISDLLSTGVDLLPGFIDISNIQKNGNFLEICWLLQLYNPLYSGHPILFSGHISDKYKVGILILENFLAFGSI